MDVTDAELAELERRFLEAHATGKVRVLGPLPHRVRLRLWCAHHRDGAAIWLAGHDHLRAAEWLWRLTGGWN